MGGRVDLPLHGAVGRPHGLVALGLPVDDRRYAEAAWILRHWGWTEVRLLTSNPDKVRGLELAGIRVIPEPLVAGTTPENQRYQQTKRDRLSHRLFKENTMRTIEGQFHGASAKVALVASRFNELVVSQLVSGARDCLVRHGTPEDQLTLAWVPGAYEIPLVAGKLAASGRYDVVITLGAVIRGSTPHFDYVASEVSKGVAAESLRTGVPIVFGVLTCDTLEQALERAGVKAGNKGWDAALVALEMVSLVPQL